MKIISLFLVLVAGTISPFAQASDELGRAEIRRLVEAGRILPLEVILERYPEKQYGRLLDLEIEREHGMMIYELGFIGEDGRVQEIKIDAENGDLLERAGAQ